MIALQASPSSATAPPTIVGGTSVTSATVERSNVDVSSPRTVRVTAQSPVVVAQAATPAATDAPAAPVNATQDNGGIPGWVWLILAILVIGIILWLLSRRKNAAGSTAKRSGDEPIIKTRK